MESSLTHGVANGQERFPQELPLLEELGLQNLNEIEAAIKRYNIDCDYERPGVIDVATSSHPPSYLFELHDDYEQLRDLGQQVEWLDGADMQAQVNSATYTGGLWRKDRAALVDPARLVWGLKSAAMSLGVRIYEDTKATSLDKDGVGVLITTPLGQGARRQGGSGHQRVQATAEAHRPLHRTRLRLLHGHRATVQRAAGRDRLGKPAGSQRHPQPVPLLPPHRGQPHPVGRIRRDLLLAAARSTCDWKAGPRRGRS